MIKQILAAGMLMVAAFLGYLAIDDEFLVFEQQFDFEDNYPDELTWGAYGVHDNTHTTADDTLALEDQSQSGTFTSDIFFKGERLQFTRVSITGSNFQYTGNQRTGYLTLQALDSGGVVAEKEHEIRNGERTVDLTTFQDLNETYTEYRFIIDLDSDEDDQTPEVEELEVEGRYFEEDVFLEESVIGGAELMLVSLLLISLYALFMR